MKSAGVIGLGVGAAHALEYFSSPLTTLEVVCDRDPKKLAEFAEKVPGVRTTQDPFDVLGDRSVDIVSIASYDAEHGSQVLMALENGKHVFAEKPLCTTPAELASIVEAAKEHPHLLLSTNLILRREPRFIELSSSIEKGEFGRVYFFEGDYDYGRIEKILDGWRGQDPGYSVILGGGIHLIDLALWFEKSPVSEVFAYGNKSFFGHDLKFSAEDFVVALIKFESGAVAKISANFGSVTRHHHRIAVYGTDRTFVQSHGTAGYIDSRDQLAPVLLGAGTYPAAQKSDLLRNFINAVGGREDLVVTSSMAFDALRVALAIESSLKLSQPVQVKKDLSHD